MSDRAAYVITKWESDHNLMVRQVARSKLKLFAGTGSIADRGARVRRMVRLSRVAPIAQQNRVAMAPGPPTKRGDGDCKG